MRVLGRGIAALIRDVSVNVDIDGSKDVDEDTASENTSDAKRNEQNETYLTPPELRARIRESLSPIFFDDTATTLRKIEAITHPLRNDLTHASFAHLRGGKLYRHDTKRMNAFRGKGGKEVCKND